MITVKHIYMKLGTHISRDNTHMYVVKGITLDSIIIELCPFFVKVFIPCNDLKPFHDIQMKLGTHVGKYNTHMYSKGH